MSKAKPQPKRGKNLVESHRAAEKRRNLITAGVLALLVVAIIGGAVWSAMSSRDTTPKATDLVAPANVTADYGIVLDADDVGGEVPADEVPRITLYEDFSCPACKNFEEMANATLVDLVKDGKADIEYRLVGFLDDGPVVGEHSKRAASASLCVRESNGMEGWKKFHDWLYENQPIEGTEGPSNRDFVAAAEDLGLQVDEACVTSEKYVPWMQQTTDKFNEDQVGGTPTVLVNGEVVESSPAAIVEAVEAAN